MKVFIVPYRDRPEHKHFFLNYIKNVLPDEKYEIYFAHQQDNRPFNRGAMKNIGFLAIKEKYPNDYRCIHWQERHPSLQNAYGQIFLINPIVGHFCMEK